MTCPWEKGRGSRWQGPNYSCSLIGRPCKSLSITYYHSLSCTSPADVSVGKMGSRVAMPDSLDHLIVTCIFVKCLCTFKSIPYPVYGTTHNHKGVRVTPLGVYCIYVKLDSHITLRKRSIDSLKAITWLLYVVHQHVKVFGLGTVVICEVNFLTTWLPRN